MLETSILNQVRSVFQNLEAQYTFHITCHPRHESAQELTELLKDVAGCSDKLSCEVTETEEPKLEFSLLKNGKETGVKFRGIPNGHEFTSLLLAVLNADGKGKNLPDEAISRRIQALKGPISLQTYVSLTCTNCPDVVQALNIMALLNGQVTHEMIDGALFQEEVDALKIQGVPSVYANGKLLHVGRGTLGELLQKLEEMFGSEPVGNAEPISRTYDVLVLGGGPAGASAAIYSARKGLRVAIVAEKVGGQVKETVGIENLISVPQTTGAQLADNLRSHINHYPIDLAGICRKVTVFEFADTLKADQVLQEKAKSLPNVEIFTSSQTTKVVGNGDKVTAIRVKDRVSSEERDFPLDGIFVQIGLAANSAPFRDMLETTPIGEIKIDAFCRTTLPGVYAAGDVSNVPYKQIVIAMGEGAKAALSAFDDRIRGIA